MVGDRAARAPAEGCGGHHSATTRDDSPRTVNGVVADDAECRQPLWGSLRKKAVVALASMVADEPPCRGRCGRLGRMLHATSPGKSASRVSIFHDFSGAQGRSCSVSIRGSRPGPPNAKGPKAPN
jgi:hypothetical protein